MEDEDEIQWIGEAKLYRKLPSSHQQNPIENPNKNLQDSPKNLQIPSFHGKIQESWCRALVLGLEVEVHGLQSQPELNGKTGPLVDSLRSQFRGDQIPQDGA
eukprot:s89_g23.t1